MNRPYILNLTDEEKAELVEVAEVLGISLNELVNIALAEAVQENSAGVYHE
jgi:predicted HicB family RNase H-like nuclease